MTLSSTISKQTYAGDGATTSFPIPFLFLFRIQIRRPSALEKDEVICHDGLPSSECLQGLPFCQYPRWPLQETSKTFFFFPNSIPSPPSPLSFPLFSGAILWPQLFQSLFDSNRASVFRPAEKRAVPRSGLEALERGYPAGFRLPEAKKTES